MLDKQLKDLIVSIITGTIASSILLYCAHFFDTEGVRLAVIVATLSILIAYYILRARRSMSSPTVTAWPSTFWAVVFGRIPVTRGLRETNEEDRPEAVLVIVNWGDPVENAVQLAKEKFKEVGSVDFRTTDLSLGSTRADQIGRLRMKLAGANCLVLVRCEPFEKRQYIYDEVDKWCTIESHVPCLVHDLLSPEESTRLENSGVGQSKIPDRFATIDLSAPLDIPWRLANRAGHRSNAWRKVALDARRILFFVCVLCGIGLLGLFVYRKYNSAMNESSVEARAANREFGVMELYQYCISQSLRNCLDPDHHVKVNVWVKCDQGIRRIAAYGGEVRDKKDVNRTAQSHYLVRWSFTYPETYFVQFPLKDSVAVFDRNRVLIDSLSTPSVFAADSITYVATDGKASHSVLLARTYRMVDGTLVAITVDSRCSTAPSDYVANRDRILDFMDKMFQGVATDGNIDLSHASCD